MGTNDQIILRQIVQQKIDEMESKPTEGEFFERFVSEQVLKNYDLSYDEIEAGIVDERNEEFMLSWLYKDICCIMTLFVIGRRRQTLAM